MRGRGCGGPQRPRGQADSLHLLSPAPSPHTALSWQAHASLLPMPRCRPQALGDEELPEGKASTPPLQRPPAAPTVHSAVRSWAVLLVSWASAPCPAVHRPSAPVLAALRPMGGNLSKAPKALEGPQCGVPRDAPPWGQQHMPCSPYCSQDPGPRIPCNVPGAGRTS